MNTYIKFWIIVLITSNSFVFSQSDWHIGLEYGEYSVGFEIIHTKDYSRNYLQQGDSLFSPRPIQIGIWYPSKEISKSRYLNFVYYLSLENSDESLNIEDIDDIKKTKEKYAKFIKGSVETVFNESQYAKLNIPHLSGSFPLIIYASAQGSMGYENNLLCEQLASNGYIVVTTSSKGAYSKMMHFNEEGAEAQVRDLEFLFGFMNSYPNVDIQNIGAIGYSFGGLNMVTLALKNKNIKCLVSLDGSIFSPLGESIIESYKYLDIGSLNSAFLGFLGDKTEANNSLILTKTKIPDIYLLGLKHHNHLDFSSANLTISNRPDSIKMGYVNMANLSLSFVDKYLKNNSKFDDKIENYSSEYYKYLEQRISNGEPKIKKEAFINYFQENGLDKGLQVYSETKKDFPEYVLFDYEAFRDLGFLRMMRKDYKNAIRVFEVLMEEYPENPDSYRRLGEAYMEDGNLEKAKHYIEQGLEIEPDSPAMNDILRIINERSKE